ncbi:hypothetical protein [Dyadobacter psychrophilus]|uniref:Uncharacterized protein n=1 Tax=Dyadobacter psychrophilus TaxID=651661 RepID=A0A1T5HEG8_9BACT|nr:hypothetical protein [Dyadobacter psychrophilus]SKC19034.1 hypothetical protein SAMN05660293_05413 [Dyadobacter psychrophilus]
MLRINTKSGIFDTFQDYCQNLNEMAASGGCTCPVSGMLTRSEDIDAL